MTLHRAGGRERSEPDPRWQRDMAPSHLTRKIWLVASAVHAFATFPGSGVDLMHEDGSTYQAALPGGPVVESVGLAPTAA